jgi:integrase
VRTNELRLARWSEIRGDLWTVPGERMKMGRPHLVPLSPRAVALFARLREIAGDSEWVVPAVKGLPISQNTMMFALYRLGYRSRLTIHGFRAMFSTTLNERRKELGFETDWIELQLAHVESNRVRGAYNAAEYLEDRRRMMRWWSAYLDNQADLGELI